MSEAAHRGGQIGATFSFPFYTIESVAIVDADHILVANDNNLGFSWGRQIGRNDDSEFILLYVPSFCVRGRQAGACFDRGRDCGQTPHDVSDRRLRADAPTTTAPTDSARMRELWNLGRR